jgi:hypothetical protein
MFAIESFKGTVNNSPGFESSLSPMGGKPDKPQEPKGSVVMIQKVKSHSHGT